MAPGKNTLWDRAAGRLPLLDRLPLVGRLRGTVGIRFTRFAGVALASLATSELTLGLCDGVFRLTALPVGTYSVRTFYIGYTPAQVDSVRVTAGQAAVVSLSLTTTAVQLAELEVTAAEPAKISSAAGLLAEQQNAPATSKLVPYSKKYFPAPLRRGG